MRGERCLPDLRAAFSPGDNSHPLGREPEGAIAHAKSSALEAAAVMVRILASRAQAAGPRPQLCDLLPLWPVYVIYFSKAQAVIGQTGATGDRPPGVTERMDPSRGSHYRRAHGRMRRDGTVIVPHLWVPLPLGSGYR